MKKFMILLCVLLFTTIPAFAGQYDIILKDGSKLNVDSYRKANGKIYYPSSYGIEGFVDENEVIKIIDLNIQEKYQELKGGLADLREDSIKKMFELIIANFIDICKKKHPTLNPSMYNFDKMQYEINKTDSLLFPYEGKIIINDSTYYEHYHQFRFNKDTKKWEFLTRIQALTENNIPKIKVLKCIPIGTNFDYRMNNPCPVHDDTLDSLNIQNE